MSISSDVVYFYNTYYRTNAKLNYIEMKEWATLKILLCKKERVIALRDKCNLRHVSYVLIHRN